jgi:hypothetical protein
MELNIEILCADLLKFQDVFHPLMQFLTLRKWVQDHAPSSLGTKEYKFTLDKSTFFGDSETLWDSGVISGDTIYLGL